MILTQISVIKCQRLPILLNGGYQPAKYSVNYGNEVVAVCDKGYAYNGSRTRVCQENNKWSGVQGTCTGLYLRVFLGISGLM